MPGRPGTSAYASLRATAASTDTLPPKRYPPNSSACGPPSSAIVEPYLIHAEDTDARSTPKPDECASRNDTPP